MNGGGRDGSRGKRAGHAGPRIFRGMSIPASCQPPISIPAAALSSNSSSNSVRPSECTRSNPDTVQKYPSSPPYAKLKIITANTRFDFFFYLLSLAHHINNKIVLTTRLFLPRCVLESRGSRRSSTPIRTDPIFTGRSYNVCSGVVSWVEREGRRRRRKLREKEP